MKQKKTTINIGDLARFCMKSIAEFPMLERQIRYIYINALEDIENGETLQIDFDHLNNKMLIVI